ncbi:MAG TPA: hypothetical protein VGE47_11685 [Burkholderiaceae bacterium]
MAQTAQIELNIAPVDVPAESASPHARLGFELGWDFAHHGLTPPVAHLFGGSTLRQGWQAGRATFGRRTLKGNAQTQRWLSLRTHAWTRGRSFESIAVTPNYLQQIDTDHCPVRRTPLAEDRSVDRLRDDAGYAAGNLAVMSAAANRAKAAHSHASASAVALSVAAGPITTLAGLDTAEWQRVATLCSFVTALPHEQAAALPLHVLPPNRVHLFNPIQALQALVTRQLATPGWHQHLERIEALLPAAIRADFNRFVLALVPRVLAATTGVEAQQIRWALEDAWGDALVQKRWIRFALQLTGTQAETLVRKAAARRLSGVHVQEHSCAADGWALDRAGYRAAA